MKKIEIPYGNSEIEFSNPVPVRNFSELISLNTPHLLGNLIGDPDNQAGLAIEKWVDTVGLDYVINAVVIPENKLYKVVAEYFVKVHRVGVQYAKQVWSSQSRKRIDIAVVSSHPADINFLQGISFDY